MARIACRVRHGRAVFAPSPWRFLGKKESGRKALGWSPTSPQFTGSVGTGEASSAAAPAASGGWPSALFGACRSIRTWTRSWLLSCRAFCFKRRLRRSRFLRFLLMRRRATRASACSALSLSMSRPRSRAGGAELAGASGAEDAAPFTAAGGGGPAVVPPVAASGSFSEESDSTMEGLQGAHPPEEGPS